MRNSGSGLKRRHSPTRRKDPGKRAKVDDQKISKQLNEQQQDPPDDASKQEPGKVDDRLTNEASNNSEKHCDKISSSHPPTLSNATSTGPTFYSAIFCWPDPPAITPLLVQKTCPTRLKYIHGDCLYGKKCRYSHDCPRCRGYTHSAINCPKAPDTLGPYRPRNQGPKDPPSKRTPLYTIRILTPMTPCPTINLKPSPDIIQTPAYDPVRGVYNSTSYLMGTAVHPGSFTMSSSAEDFADGDFGYGSMDGDNMACEALYGMFMESPVVSRLPAPHELFDDFDLDDVPTERLEPEVESDYQYDTEVEPALSDQEDHPPDP